MQQLAVERVANFCEHVSTLYTQMLQLSVKLVASVKTETTCCEQMEQLSVTSVATFCKDQTLQGPYKDLNKDRPTNHLKPP